MAEPCNRRSGWRHDAVKITTTTKMSTTGGTVWKAAERAVEFLEAMCSVVGLDRPGVRILELGAGCGLIG